MQAIAEEGRGVVVYLREGSVGVSSGGIRGGDGGLFEPAGLLPAAVGGVGGGLPGGGAAQVLHHVLHLDHEGPLRPQALGHQALAGT